MFEYDKDSSNAVKVLDKYDFTKDIEYCKRVGCTLLYDMRNAIGYGRDYDDEVADALDELSTDEFMEYFTDRYGVHWEVVEYYFMR